MKNTPLTISVATLIALAAPVIPPMAQTRGGNATGLPLHGLDAGCAPPLVSSHGITVRLEDGYLQHSHGTTNWRNCALPVRTFMRDFVCNQELFVAVGGSYIHERAVILTSTNGSTWTRRRLKTKHNLYSVAFGNNLFIAVGDSGIICTSANAIEWNEQRPGPSALFAAVAVGNNIFVAGGESGTILTSTDAVNWTVGNIGVPICISKMAFVSGKFVVADGDRAFTSENGLAWRGLTDY